jgi:hypothetical protein
MEIPQHADSKPSEGEHTSLGAIVLARFLKKSSPIE